MITVASDGTATFTGGTPALATAPIRFPVTGLPSGHTLETGTIPAGESRTILEADGMRTTVTCPAGGAACMITVASDGTATFTGGTPALATAFIPVASVDWLEEPAFGWDGQVTAYDDSIPNTREFRDDPYHYSWWGELRNSSDELLGYYGIQSRGDGPMQPQPWFMRHTDTSPPARGSSASATWSGNFLGIASRHLFPRNVAGWAQARDIDARLADTSTVVFTGQTVQGDRHMVGDAIPTVGQIAGPMSLQAQFGPAGTTFNFHLTANYRDPKGFGYYYIDNASRPLTGIFFGGEWSGLTPSFTVEPGDSTFSFSPNVPQITSNSVPALNTFFQGYNISGAFVGAGGHGVLGTIDRSYYQVLSAGINTVHLRGAFGALREE